MINSNETKILEVINDNEYLNILRVSKEDIIKAVNIAIEEVKELELIVQDSYKSGKTFKSLCKELRGHNEFYNAKYPDYNYFDLNYKSLLITIKENLDKDNKGNEFKVIKNDVYIYPDNISKVATDEMFTLNLEEDIDIEKIKDNINIEIMENEQ